MLRPTRFLPAPVKRTARSAEKVDIKGLGDAACLGDAVRGTVVLAASRADLIELMYDFFEALVAESNVSGVLGRAQDAMAKHGAHVRYFKDRYAHPKGDYRDWLFQFEVEGFVSEMQFNFNVGIVDKEGDLHLQYEKERKLEDNLLQAAMHCNVSAVDAALKAGVKVDKAKITDAHGRTPLHYAAFHGQDGMVLSLLAKRASPLVGDDDGLLPINRAIVRNHSSVIRILAEAMESRREEMSSMPDSQKHALLIGWSIARRQNREHADELLKVAEIAVPSKQAKLHAAATMGNAAICQQVVELVGGLDQRDLFRLDPAGGHTCFAIDSAILWGNPLAAVAFAKAGGFLVLNPDKKDGALHCNPHKAAECYVTNNLGAQLQALLAVAAFESRFRHHSGGSTKNWKDMEGSTIDLPKLSSKALAVRNFAALSILQEYGSTLPAEDVPVANILLADAAGRGALDVVEALLQARASANSIDDRAGHAPLHLAANGGNLPMCKLLIRFRADVDIPSTVYKQSPMHGAAVEGRVEIIRLLLDARASPDGPEETQWSPGYFAVWRGHLPAVQLLHEAGAQMPVCRGKDFLQTARQYDHPAVVSFLEQIAR